MDYYKIEEHPFGSYIPQNAKILIIGTFPTHNRNLKFDFYYSGKDNLFWGIIEKVFDHSFSHFEGVLAVEERKSFLDSKSIGVADMHKLCYRKNNMSTDENLHPIILNDIFLILDEYHSIHRIVLTSRTEVYGALGLLKTYFLQNGLELNHPEKRNDRVLEGTFIYKRRKFKLLVPYSTSPRLLKRNIKMDELIYMYSQCLF